MRSKIILTASDKSLIISGLANITNFDIWVIPVALIKQNFRWWSFEPTKDKVESVINQCVKIRVGSMARSIRDSTNWEHHSQELFGNDLVIMSQNLFIFIKEKDVSTQKMILETAIKIYKKTDSYSSELAIENFENLYFCNINGMALVFQKRRNKLKSDIFFITVLNKTIGR